VLEGQGTAAPCPTPPSSPQPFFLRFAPGRFRLTIPISFGNIEVPASLRSTPDRFPSGTVIGLAPESPIAFSGILKDRYQVRSLILTSQLPVTRWHEQIGDPTMADGILDRLVHNAHRIEMRGDSMRKNRGKSNT
jgi:hypothetical protein